MTEEKIPDWALERAAEECNKEPACFGKGWTKVNVYDWAPGRALGRYIASHEKPPIDPDMIEARNLAIKDLKGYPYSVICAGITDGSTGHSWSRDDWCDRIDRGLADNSGFVQARYIAIKLGRKLAEQDLVKKVDR